MADDFDREVQRRLAVAGPYCSDPNCVYCKDLRETQEEVSKGRQRSLLSDNREIAV